jgi:hypothetical protein
MYRAHTKAARRLPPLADQSVVDPSEHEAYNRAVRLVRKFNEHSPAADARPRIDGQPYGVPYYAAWTNAPRLFTPWFEIGQELVAVEGMPGRFSRADHELTDFVIGFDSGYWLWHGGHTANAITGGVRIETLEALAEEREQDLTDVERQQVEFIRAVRDCSMTDEVWERMVSKLGSVRGTMEFACFVCHQLGVHRMAFALGVPAVDIEDWRKLVYDYKHGIRNAEHEAEDYGEVRRRAEKVERG